MLTSNRADAAVAIVLAATLAFSRGPAVAWAGQDRPAEPACDDGAAAPGAARFDDELQVALDALSHGREAEALERLQGLVDRDPSSPARRTLGPIHLGSGRLHPAYTHLRQWLRQQPADDEARRSAAFAAVQLGRLGEAEELLASLDATAPRTALLWGDIHLRKGEAEAAVAALEPLRGAPQVPPTVVRRLLAEAYLLADRHGDVVALLGTGDEPEQPDLAMLLAESRFESGDVTGAAAALWRHSESDLAGLRGSLGRYLVMAGRFGDAVPLLESAVSDDPEDRTAWESLGRALFATGRRDAAQGAAATARRLAEMQTKESQRQLEHHRALRDPSKVRRARAVA